MTSRKKNFYFMVQCMIVLYLVKYIKMLTISQQSSEKEKESTREIRAVIALFQQL